MKNPTEFQINKNIFGKPQKHFIDDLGTILFFFVIAVFIVFIAFSKVYTGISVNGPSMMPTFNKEFLDDPMKEDIAYYTAVENNEFKRGDIVIASTGGTDPIIKRVIGLPGEKVKIARYVDGRYYVFINNQRQIENYILSQEDMVKAHKNFVHLFGKNEILVPSGELFILGDNRGNSNDSTFYGCFKFENILGRVDYTVDADKIPFVDLFIQFFLPIFK